MQGHLALINSCSPSGEVEAGMCKWPDWGLEGGWMDIGCDRLLFFMDVGAGRA